WPPNAPRMMEIMRSVKLFSSRERRRRMSDSVMTGADMLRSMASVTVQRPSPESGTKASRPASEGFLSSASAVRSRSQERTMEPPDPAGCATVNEFEAPKLGLSVAALGVLVVGVAAIDESIALLQERFELHDGLVDGVAGRDHDPDSTRSGKILDEIFQRVDA